MLWFSLYRVKVYKILFQASFLCMYVQAHPHLPHGSSHPLILAYWLAVASRQGRPSDTEIYWCLHCPRGKGWLPAASNSVGLNSELDFQVAQKTREGWQAVQVHVVAFVSALTHRNLILKQEPGGVELKAGTINAFFLSLPPNCW